MSKPIQSNFDGVTVQFDKDGWLHATAIAARFDKEPAHWLRSPETLSYLAALGKMLNCNSVDLTELNKINHLDSSKAATKAKILRLCKQTGLVKAKAGAPETGGGTWLHPKLAVVFARWLSVDFAIWCDMQIDSIIHQPKEQSDWKRLRHETAASFKVMAAMLEAHRKERGKETKAHHYSNEARLVNYALTGVFSSVNRDGLSDDELDRLAMLEQQNTLMIARGIEYEQRKSALERLASGALKVVK